MKFEWIQLWNPNPLVNRNGNQNIQEKLDNGANNTAVKFPPADSQNGRQKEKTKGGKIKNQCLPFVVKENEAVGRYMMANRDIKPLEASQQNVTQLQETRVTHVV